MEGQSNLYSLADLLPDKLIFILEMGKIIYANEKFLKVTGYTIQELNENMKEIPSFNNEELTSYTIKVKTKSGQVREIKFSTENIQLQGWQIILAVGIDTANYIVLDNRQTETEKKYQTLVENIND